MKSIKIPLVIVAARIGRGFRPGLGPAKKPRHGERSIPLDMSNFNDVMRAYVYALGISIKKHPKRIILRA